MHIFIKKFSRQEKYVAPNYMDFSKAFDMVIQEVSWSRRSGEHRGTGKRRILMLARKHQSTWRGYCQLNLLEYFHYQNQKGAGEDLYELPTQREIKCCSRRSKGHTSCNEIKWIQVIGANCRRTARAAACSWPAARIGVLRCTWPQHYHLSPRKCWHKKAILPLKYMAKYSQWQARNIICTKQLTEPYLGILCTVLATQLWKG